MDMEKPPQMACGGFGNQYFGLIYGRSESGEGRIWMPETMPMAMNMVTMDLPP